MKTTLFILLFCSTLLPENGNRKLFDEFHSSFQNGDFNKLSNLLSDDFTAIDENGKTVMHKKEYLSYLQGWSLTFGTQWKITDVKEKDDTIFSIEEDSSMFNDYFMDGDFKCRYTYLFKAGKLASMEWDSLPGFAAKHELFNSRFQLFYMWVYKNYPDKVSLITDQDAAAAIETKKMLIEYLSTLKS